MLILYITQHIKSHQMPQLTTHRHQKTKRILRSKKLRLLIFISTFAVVTVFGISILTGNTQQSNIGTSLASAQEPADLNNDNKVDVFDLSYMLNRWLTADLIADITKDGTVNIFDLSRLLGKWGLVGGSSTCSTVAAYVPGGSDGRGGCWPGPDNTGIPTGTVLSEYTGPCNITAANTVIDAKTVNCVLSINAANVTITNSQINGGVDVPSGAPSGASFTISDSNVEITSDLGTGLMRRNFTANRVEITGGRRSAYCMSNCTIENSWVHDQGVDPNGVAHFSGIRMEQYTTVRHNSITCEATRSSSESGCSAGLTGYADFAPIRDNLIENNLFYRGGNGGSTTCAYGGATTGKPYSDDPTNATNIRFVGNRFVKGENGLCGNIRTIISFDPTRLGNVWTDNLYHDGTVVNATGP
jgi:hypothetical protein